MRFAVFVFSLILIIMPTYAHALVWFGAGAVKGMIARTSLMGFVKVGSKKAFSGAMMMAGAKGFDHSVKIVKDYCKKTKKCDDIVENASELFGDDDLQSKQYDGLLFVTSQGGYKEFNNPVDMCKYYMGNIYSETYEINLDEHFAHGKGGTDYQVGDYVSCKGDIKFMPSYGLSMNFTGGHEGRVIAKPQSNKPPEQKELTKEQIQKIVNNISDDDVTYIINNYGDDIEIQKYCSENACDELSNEFGQEVQNNQDKYDIDKINKANCVVKNGKIVSCDNAKIDKDDEDDDSTQEDDTDNSDNSSDNDGTKEDDKKINCEASEFHKKVCDFIDWYQDDFDHDNTDTSAEVDDKTDDLPKHKDYIKFNAQCPPDKIINLSFAGVNKSLTWTYKDFCHAMIELKPFVVGFSMITGAFIIAGRRV